MLKVCKVDGCGRNVSATGYCIKHYLRFKKHGTTDLTERQLRLCTVEGCSKKHYGRGYCANHYHKYFFPGYSKRYNQNAQEGEKVCSLSGCKRIMYAKGFCRKHHANYIRTGNPEGVFKDRLLTRACSVVGCGKKADALSRNKRAYCKFHHLRKLAKNAGHIKCSLKRPKGVKGELNHNWNGGVAEYPNHSVFKRARKRILEKYDHKCAQCGGEAKHVHHKDGTKHNHSDENLEPLCVRCHHKTFKEYTSKFKRLYGASLVDIGLRLAVSPVTVKVWHEKGILSSKLTQLPPIPTLMSEAVSVE